MDCALSSITTTHRTLSFSLPSGLANRRKPYRPLLIVGRAGSSHCEPSSSSSSIGFSSLNTPFEPKSAAGRFLSGVFQNQRQLFQVAVADELRLLAEERDSAVSRMFLSSRSEEASLHRRIAELKEHECQMAVEDVMYMLIFSKFSEIHVPLVPKLSRCIYNGRLEIVPSKDWELESIHNFEVLEMIKEHVSTVIGLKVNSSVTDNWATTEIPRLCLGRIYAGSILYGYFLKSAILRHHLDQCLSISYPYHLCHRTSLQFLESAPYGLSNLVFGRMSNMESATSSQGSSRNEWQHESLRSYVMGFDTESLQRCAKLKSKEAKNLIEKHSRALFGDESTGLLENDEVIVTSFSSMKRLVLEAVAFGSFLWDTEEYVNAMFRLKEN